MHITIHTTYFVKSAELTAVLFDFYIFSSSLNLNYIFLCRIDYITPIHRAGHFQPLSCTLLTSSTVWLILYYIQYSYICQVIT